MKKYFTFLILLCTFATSFAQWSPTVMQGEKVRNNTKASDYFKLNLTELKAQLSNAVETGRNAKAVEVSIPTMSGKVETFAVYSLPVVVKELAMQYQLGSYVGVGVTDPTKYIRFSVAPNDFQAMIIQNGDYQFIEPANKAKTVYEVHPKTVKSGDKAFLCSTTENALSKKDIQDLYNKGKSFSNNPTNFAKNSDKKYRTMRLAMSVTAEYTTYFGGVAGAMTAINATLTRVNGVFEKDFALHLNMQNYPALIYTNAATDPYDASNLPAPNGMTAWNAELQATLTSVVGTTNYDIGHLFGATGGGGNAGCIGCVCVAPTTAVPNGKGSGFTSPADGIPSGDNFDIDYVAHEMGHQLGGNHTFSHALEGTGVNVEPGSGSTIMGYAGITGTTTDVQAHSDAYFHTVSINQVQANLISKTCDVETAITNNPPVIAALPTYSIPNGTAFVLTGSATDPESDPMTYTWEEIDDAAVIINKTNLGTTTSGASFRSISPTTSLVRYFPRFSSVLSGVLNNTNNLWEAVSTVARQQKFAFTARDNNASATQQQTATATEIINVTSDGPFKVTSTTVYNNSAGAITWNVVNTTAAPYNVANVKIDYTTDNGVTWTVLFASTPNDGSENYQFSTLATGATLKIRVSSIGNVFYAIGSATVAVMQTCSTTTAPTGIAVSGITQTGATVTWNAAVGATYNLQYRKVGATVWTPVNGLTTNTYTIPGLTESTQYEVQVAYVCSSVVGVYSASTLFTTLGLTYCAAASSIITDEWISNVTVTPTGAAVMSSTSTASTYTNYTTDATRLINLVIGSTGNQLSISKGWLAGAPYDEGIGVWIDFNRNGVFETSEQVVATVANQTTPVTQTFTVPTGAYNGGLNTRMRVVLDYDTAPVDPCLSFTYGEVEDYAVKLLTSTVTCLPPTPIAPSAITGTTATISWTAPTPVPANGYQYYVSTTNTAPIATTTPTGSTTATTVNLTALTPNTTYYWWVRSACSATDISTWATGTSFTTLQTPATLPYTQPFTGPNDFVFINGTQTNKWAYGTAAGNPANAIYVSNDSGVTNAYTNTSLSVVQAYRDFIIPAGTTNATFSFDWRSVGEASYDYLRVWLVPTTYVPVAGTQTTAGTGRIQITGANFPIQATWLNYLNTTLNISSFAGTTMRLLFEWRNDGTAGTNPPAAIDNINLFIPTCQVPTALTYSAITSTSATISWTAASPVPALGYQYYVSTTNTAPIATTTPTGSTTATSVNLSALTPNTTYYFWVRSSCSTTDSSIWISGGSFTTGQIPTTIPYVQPFNGIPDFTVVNGTQTNKWVIGSAAGNPANGLYISNDNGVTNAYTNTSTSTVQAYRDIIVPTGTTTATFSFDWRSVGEANYDYLRVWLVPVSYVPVAGTQITAGTGRIQVTGANFPIQATWLNYFNPTLNISSFAGTTMRLVFEWRNDNILGTNPPAAIDNINLSIPTCQVPTALVSSAILSTTATISWTAASPVPANGYQYYLSTTNTAPIATTTPTGSTTATSVNLTALTPNTTYYWWVRSKCIGTDASFWMIGGSFTTAQIPATIPYVQPFNGTPDFTFVNGTQTNQWATGSATGNPANSMYVTNDSGVTNAYTNTSLSVVQAYRDIIIPPLTTTVTFAFDWKSVGEVGYDYLRVWLVPISYVPVAGTQITAGTGRIQVTGANFPVQSTWQQYNNQAYDLSSFAGQTMRLVFEWRNDGILGSNPPAAIDNVRIVRCSNTTPVVTINAITQNSATVTWPQDPGGASYILRYRPIGYTPGWLATLNIPAAAYPATTNTYNLVGLSPVTNYEVEIVAICQNTQGTYSHNEFITKCDPAPPANFTVTNITTTTALVSWAATLSATYQLEYRAVGATTWIPITPAVTSTSYTLTGLIPYTTYEVHVASICSGATNPFTTPKVFTTLPTCQMAPIGLTVTNITMTTAQADWNAYAGATYVLKWRKVGFPTWTTVNLTTNTYNFTGLLELTQYEVQVANVCGGTTQTFTPSYVFSTPTVVYCNMTSASAAAEYISNVKVTPNGKPVMTNDSGLSTYTSYVSNSAKVVELIQGSTNNQISIAKTWVQTQYNDAITVWIDFNRNGIFEVSERVLTSPANKLTPITGTFTVPTDSFVSLTNDKYVVMRVAMQRDGSPLSCVNFANGEVEDYKVKITKLNTINALDPNTIFIYPNPVSDILNISKIADGSGYTVYDSAGQLVSQGKIYGKKLDVSKLQRGIYVIDIDNNGETAQKKFIKE